MNETGEFAVGFAGRKLKLVDRGWEARTGMVWELVAVWVGVDASDAVSIAVNDWAVV